jgi:DNA mismatch repair protein MutL
VLEVKEAGHPRGTSVEIRDLFGAIPARKKFLRSDATELGHLAEALTLLALAHPEVGFTLSTRGRKLIETPSVAERGARIYQLFGAEALRDLQAVAGGADWARVSGFVPRARAGRRLSLRLFVNGRPVRDRGIAKAVTEGYRRSGQGDPRGDAFLFVEAPLHLVDVNVHPAKSEVRFADARVIWEAVTRAVSASLSAVGRAEVKREPPQRAAESRPEADWNRVLPDVNDRSSAGKSPLVEDAGPIVLGQHRNTYLVATDGEELLLVDQHTAHERVRFERLQSSLAARSVDSQRLLVPVVCEIAPRIRPLIEEHADTLSALGFDVEAFGGGSIHIASVPALLGTRDPGPALEALLRELVEREAADWIVSSQRDRLAATLACHSSVKAGEGLSRERMSAIVGDLMKAEHPLQCPHGRPTLVRIPREDVTRWFGRTGWRRQ